MTTCNRVYAWDPGYDHDMPRVKNLRDFVRCLTTDRQRLALTLDVPSKDAFELFCRALWERVLNGENRVVIVVEEAAGVQRSVGQAGEWWSQLLTQSRKFGGIILATSQRAQEIDKTLFTQVQNLYVGAHARKDCAYIAREIDVPEEAIYNLPIGQFWHKVAGPTPATLVDFDQARNGARRAAAKKNPAKRKKTPAKRKKTAAKKRPATKKTPPAQ